MEGNPLMDDIKDLVLQKLRKGETVVEIKTELLDTLNELKSMEVYIQAIKDADFAP